MTFIEPAQYESSHSSERVKHVYEGKEHEHHVGEKMEDAVVSNMFTNAASATGKSLTTSCS